MEIDLSTLLTAGIALAALVGGMIIRDRQVMKAIGDGDERERKHTDELTAELHKRINRMQENYARRDDLDKHMETIEGMVNSIRDEQRETNRRIDELLRAMTGK